MSDEPEQPKDAACPVCSNTNGVEGHSINHRPDRIDQEMTCNICGADWCNAYEYIHYYGAQNETYPVDDWRHDVAQGNTQLGYKAWVQHRVESETTESDP